jgi:hypothetical protein
MQNSCSAYRITAAVDMVLLLVGLIESGPSRTNFSQRNTLRSQKNSWQSAANEYRLAACSTAEHGFSNAISNQGRAQGKSRGTGRLIQVSWCYLSAEVHFLNRQTPGMVFCWPSASLRPEAEVATQAQRAGFRHDAEVAVHTQATDKSKTGIL